MTESIHPVASHHLPSFITAPGEIDVAHGYNGHNPAVVRAEVGVLYFRLHALPERFAHKKVQFEIAWCVSAFSHVHTCADRFPRF